MAVGCPLHVLRVESRDRVCVVKKCVVVHKDSVVMTENLFTGVGYKTTPYIYFPLTSTCTWAVLFLWPSSLLLYHAENIDI